MKNADKPINPLRGATNIPFQDHDTLALQTSLIGLTKRELFAYGAQNAILSNSRFVTAIYESLNHQTEAEAQKAIAIQALRNADALLTALETKEGE